MSVTFTDAEIMLLRNLMDAGALDKLIYTLRKEADQQWTAGDRDAATATNKRANAYREVQRKLYAPLSNPGGKT